MANLPICWIYVTMPVIFPGENNRSGGSFFRNLSDNYSLVLFIIIL